MIAFPLAGATATLVGQDLGAGNQKRVWKSLWAGLSIHATLMITMAMALFFYRIPFLEAFSSDAPVVEIGDEMLFYQLLRFISLANSIFNVALGTYLAVGPDYGPSGIFISGLVRSVFVTIITAGWIATGRWTRRGAQPFDVPC